MRRPILQTAGRLTATTLMAALLAGCGQKGPLVPADSPEAQRTRKARAATTVPSTPPTADPAAPASSRTPAP